MFCYAFTYEYTYYRRRQTCGGMDSEPDGTELRTTTEYIVVPEQSPRWQHIALSQVDWRAKQDQAFKVTLIGGHQINGIMSVQTRL